MGNKLAHGLRAAGFEGKLVFFTASPDFGDRGLRCERRRLSLKPVEHERLKTVMGISWTDTIPRAIRSAAEAPS